MTDSPDSHVVPSIDQLKSVRMENEFAWSFGERLCRVPSTFVSVAYHCNQVIRCDRAVAAKHDVSCRALAASGAKIRTFS
eukprot:682308-Hanusia_phi.AAC.1